MAKKHRHIKKPEVPDAPAEGKDGYMGALMTVHEDDEELLYAGTGTKNNRDFSATDAEEEERREEEKEEGKGNAQD